MITSAIRQDRHATCRRSSDDMPRVKDKKMGASPGGSSVTIKVTRADVAKSKFIAHV